MLPFPIIHLLELELKIPLSYSRSKNRPNPFFPYFKHYKKTSTQTAMFAAVVTRLQYFRLPNKAIVSHVGTQKILECFSSCLPSPSLFLCFSHFFPRYLNVSVGDQHLLCLTTYRMCERILGKSLEVVLLFSTNLKSFSVQKVSHLLFPLTSVSGIQ